MKYNLALLCKSRIHADALIHLSKKLRDAIPSIYVLGENSYPHVTICQFEAEETNIDSIWKSVLPIEPHFKVNPVRYYWSPKIVGNGFYYTGLEVLCSDDLYVFHKKVISALNPVEATNVIGHQFFPHFTLGCCQLGDVPPDFLPLNDDIWTQDIEVKLALGESGPEYQFKKILYEQ